MSDTCRSCGAEVVFVPSFKTGRPMTLDAKPEKRVVVGSKITSIERDDALVVGAQHEGAEMVARVTDTYLDHHARCPAAAAWKGRTRKDPAP
jgi:hypothetical protein